MKNLLCFSFLLLCLLPLGAQENNETWRFNSADTINKGVEYHDSEAYDSAIALFKKVHPGDTNYHFAVYEMAMSYNALEEYDKAIETAERGLKLDKGLNPQFLTLIANSHDDAGRPERAMAIYDTAIARYPSSARLHYNRAVTLLKQGENERALADLKTAVELQPAHAASHLELAKLALNEQAYSQALMSLGYFFIAEPNTGRANSALVSFNKALSEKTALESRSLKLNRDENYRLTDKLVASYAALRSDYEMEGDASYPLAKQFHLALYQLKELKIGDGFWENYYLPYYQKMLDESYFNEFALLMVVTSSSEYYQNLLKKNLKKIQQFLSWSRETIGELQGWHHAGYVPKNSKLRYYFYDGAGELNARGKADKKGEPIGNYEFFYRDGSLFAKGAFNKKNERSGSWTFYHPNGKIKQTVTYKDGLFDGESREYFDNGKLEAISNYKKGELKGSAEVFYRHGSIQRKMNIEDKMTIDTIFYFYEGGSLSAKLPQQKGMSHGKATYHHPNDSLLSKIEYRNDKRAGKAKFYFFNGFVDTEAEYNEDGQFEGMVNSYHINGKLHEEGRYIDGVRTGEWKTYNLMGKLVSEETLDEKGKKNGSQVVYDLEGNNIAEYTYRKGAISAYRFYDHQGKLLYEDSDKKGRYTFKSFNPYHITLGEGQYDGDHKVGTWHYNNQYGISSATEHYDEDGKLQGRAVQFHENGNLSVVQNYRNDSLHGPNISFFTNGDTAITTAFVKGNKEGHEQNYFYGGGLRNDAYYVKGQLNGPMINYDPEGKIDLIKHYDLGTVVGVDLYYQDSLWQKLDLSDTKKPEYALYPNGQKRYEIQRAGPLYHGKARWYYANGQVEVEGQYANGMRVGLWKNYSPAGTLIKVTPMGLNKPHGEMREFYHDGSLKSISPYIDGILHGVALYYYPNGKLQDSINYIIDKKHGPRYFFNQDGEVDHIRIYNQGRIVGYTMPHLIARGQAPDSLKNATGKVETRYPNGKPARQYQLDSGRLVGSYRVYHSNGTLTGSYEYKYDDYDGDYLEWYPDGKPKEKTFYENGVPEGERLYYYPNGQLQFRMHFKKGMQHGLFEHFSPTGTRIGHYLYRNDDLIESYDL